MFIILTIGEKLNMKEFNSKELSVETMDLTNLISFMNLRLGKNILTAVRPNCLLHRFVITESERTNRKVESGRKIKKSESLSSVLLSLTTLSLCF
jgi:hypothetical protein